MNLNNIIKNNLEKNKVDKDSLEVYLPNTKVSYLRSEKYLPVFLEPVEIENLVAFRKKDHVVNQHLIVLY